MAGPPISVDYVPSWADRLRTRLFTEFRNKTTWNAWIDSVLAPQFDALESSAQSLFSALDIDNSSGTELDVIGRVVGQTRLAADDPTYRLYLRARIVANQSSGTPENIYSVFAALYGIAARFIATTAQMGDKAFTLTVLTVLTRTQALVGVGFLTDSKEGGARGVLEWQENPSSALFTFDSTNAAQGFDAGVFAGAGQA